jgi:hypothetical protein
MTLRVTNEVSAFEHFTTGTVREDYLSCSSTTQVEARLRGSREHIMGQRNVKDSSGRNWVCTPAATGESTEKMGRDVAISCTTSSVPGSVELMVGWQWAGMSDNGLARMIAAKSPVPKQ